MSSFFVLVGVVQLLRLFRCVPTAGRLNRVGGGWRRVVFLQFTMHISCPSTDPCDVSVLFDVQLVPVHKPETLFCFFLFFLFLSVICLDTFIYDAFVRVILGRGVRRVSLICHAIRCQPLGCLGRTVKRRQYERSPDF
uniref:Secreted protein n=1 Tax=Ixodes ricinus TaxID=34613 RepID=A0A6B0UTC2_IXORI